MVVSVSGTVMEGEEQRRWEELGGRRCLSESTISTQTILPSCLIFIPSKNFLICIYIYIYIFFFFYTSSFIFSITGGTYFHLGEFQRVLPASPGGPFDAVSIGGVLTAQVLAVEVGRVAVAVPPSTVVEGGAVILGVVVVPVFSGELHAVMLQQRVTW